MKSKQSKRNRTLLNNTSKEIERIVDKFKSNRGEMNSLGNKILKQIQVRTRLGFGVAKGNRKVRLAKLSNSYKDTRKGKIRFFTTKTGQVIRIRNKKAIRPKGLSRETTASKSNLTATGLMLNSLTAKVASRRIFITLENKKGKDIFGTPSKTSTNAKAGYQANQGRRFLDLASFEVKMFKQIVTKKLIALGAKMLKKL